MKSNLSSTRISYLVVGLLVGVLACATGSSRASAASLVSIDVTPINSTVPAGFTRQFTATGTFSDGSVQDLTASAAWSSSAPPVAVISNASGSNGLATGVATGMTQITAQLSGVLGSTTLTVTGTVLVSINVTPTNLTVAAGFTQQFTATGTFSDGSAQDLTTSVTWSSNDPSIATISNVGSLKGTTTGLSPGTTQITAQSGTVLSSTTLTVTPAPGCQLAMSVAANFTGQPINQNSYIWFSSALTPKGLGSSPATFRLVQQKITSTGFTLSVPDATVIFDPAATTATTTFTGGVWVTRAPAKGLAGDTFVSGLSYLVPANLAGGLKNVTWSGTIIPDTAGTTLQWRWAAAVYSSFSVNYNTLGVKPVDDNKASGFKNSDHAGTPENFKTKVIAGATGGGGSNYTGGISSAETTTSCDATPSLTLTKSAPAITNSTQIPYTISYRNSSAKTISNIQLSDSLPAGLTYIVGTGVPAPTTISGNTLTWNLPPLAPNTTASVVFRASVNSDGAYSNTAGVRFTQAVGAISSNTVTTLRDTVPPTVTIVSGPNGLTNVTNATFQFVTSGAVGSECKIDNGGYAPCAPAPGQYTSAPLIEGAHTFTVRAFDAAGNTASASRAFTVDVTPPIATFRAPPDNLTVTSSSTARFYFTVDDSPVTTFCSVAGDPFAPCPSPFATRSLSDGTYTVSVFARDAVGNQGPTDNFTFTIDTHAPIISIPVPPNLTTTTENTPTFIFSDVGPLGTPVIFQCRVDGGAPVLCISTFTVASPLAEGNHTFTVTATDAAGNIGQASFSFLVDTVPPVVTLTGVPPSPTHEQHPAFAFTVTGANPGSNQCSLDNGATVLNNCTTPFVPTVTDGQHTVTIRATDAAGNVGEASFAFTVDTAAPVVTIPDPPTNPTTANTATPTLFFQVANTPSTTPIVASQCRVTDASAPHAVRAQSPPNVICDASFHVPLANSLTDGPYLFEVIATDAAGNVGSASFSFVVDTNAPNVFILSPPDHTIFTTSTPSFDFNVVENGPGTLVTTQCRIYTSIVMMPPPLVSCTSPFTSSSLSDGNYFFEVVATDAAGNIGNRFLPFGINTTGNSAPVSVATAEDIITVPRP